jgi:NAD(P)-dependent dehydrogenase (short-subunit alcohol dehydrogenase family)
MSKVAYITGGASGFGAEVARQLARRGDDVVLLDVNDDDGKRVADELGGTFLHCDVSDYDQVMATTAEAEKAYGGIDLFFLNAGIATGCGVDEDFELATYRRAMGINLDGVVYGVHAALPVLRRRGGGSIVCTASMAGLTAVPFDPVYGANKHAVVGLVRAAGAGYADKGIFVNAICPGFADTNIVSPEAREALASIGVPLLDPERVVDAFMAAVTSGESGQCWYIQPGRPAEPFRFRNVPGPRDDSGQAVSDRAGDVQSTLSQRGAH